MKLDLISKDEFNRLDIFDKDDYLNENGTWVSFRKYYGYSINLYAVSGFFVEVWLFEDLTIHKIEPIYEEKILNHYLRRIKIEDMF